MEETHTVQTQEWLEITRLFLKLGLIAFGGPAAHIALFREEVVLRRKWISDERFLDLLGVVNLIPGPNSTEMAIHVGYVRGGWPGLILAGVGFIVPAMVMVMGLAWVYVQYGETPQAEWLLYGVKPVVIAIVANALWGLARKAVRSSLLGIAAVLALALYLLSFHPLAALFAGGLLVALIANVQRLRETHKSFLILPVLGIFGLPALTGSAFSLAVLFLTFLKIGAVLYGSGYVLLAFLHADFVVRLGWLTEQQLLDAVAIGQITPGPVFTTATFIGFILAGIPGAVLATVGIFLPSFIFVLLSNRFIPILRRSPWASSLLDGVIVASLGLMAGVTWELAGASVVDPLTFLIAALALFLIVKYRVNSTWLILGGAAAGLLKAVVLG